MKQAVLDFKCTFYHKNIYSFSCGLHLITILCPPVITPDETWHTRIKKRKQLILLRKIKRIYFCFWVIGCFTPNR